MTGKVYFIECAGSLKIGFTTDLPRRIINLQNAAPAKLNLLGCIDGDKVVEQNIHRHLKPHRLHGEWFAFEPVKAEVLRLLSEGAATVPVPAPKTRKPHRPRAGAPHRPNPWRDAIRSANALLAHYETLIASVPREEARAMFSVFAAAVEEIEEILDGPMNDDEAPAWLAALSQKLGALDRTGDRR